MKVLTFSRQFPKGHPKSGLQTHFVEQVWNSFNATVRDIEFFWEGEERLTEFDFNRNLPYGLVDSFVNSLTRRNELGKKHHTIRSGSRWKAGDMASLRVWSGKPYQSKQIEFAQVEVKKVWDIEIYQGAEVWEFKLNGKTLTWDDLDLNEFVDTLAKNDGLAMSDFLNWFTIHPKRKDRTFRGQIICWSDAVDYSSLTSKVNA
jgi:hypothetical protein